MAAIRNDELYVFTHPGMRGAVEERFQAILAAFDRAAAFSVLERSAGNDADVSDDPDPPRR